MLCQAQGGTSNANQQKRGRPDVMVSSFEDDSVSFIFPFGASMLSDLSLLIDLVDPLLLSEDAS